MAALGEQDSAEKTFQQAIEIGKDVSNTVSGTSALCTARFGYACFLRETSRYDQALKEFESVLQMRKEAFTGHIAGCYIQAQMCDEYAKLLRTTGSNGLANAFELEAQEWRNKEKQRKKKVREMLDKGDF